MELILEIIKILAWPYVVLRIVVLFRKPLIRLINKIDCFTIGGKKGLSASVGKDDSIEYPNQENNMLASESSGLVSFDYSNNNGHYRIENDDSIFETKWSKASDQYIYFYNDASSIKSIRLIKDKSNINEDIDFNIYDNTSRFRLVGIGQIAVFENTQDDFLVVKINKISDDTRGSKNDILEFNYVVKKQSEQKKEH